MTKIIIKLVSFMRTVAFILFFMLIAHGLVAQNDVTADTVFNQVDNNNLKQGYWKKYYKDGKIAYQGYFMDDKPRGEFLRYHENGKLRARMIYSQCGDSAFTTLFYPLGKVIAKGLFYKNQKDGEWKYYTQAGMLVLVENFKYGAKHGEFKTYYPTGEVFELVNWKNDKKDGPTIQYYINGMFKTSVLFKNGLENGPVFTYYTTGDIRLEGAYLNGRKHGTWRVLEQNGKAIKVINYNNGIAENQDELIEEETRILDEMIKNIGKIQEPTIEEFLRGRGF